VKGRPRLDRCRRCERYSLWRHDYRGVQPQYDIMPLPNGRIRTVWQHGRAVEQVEMICIAEHVWWSSHPASVAKAKDAKR